MAFAATRARSISGSEITSSDTSGRIRANSESNAFSSAVTSAGVVVSSSAMPIVPSPKRRTLIPSLAARLTSASSDWPFEPATLSVSTNGPSVTW